jgi:prepilin-type processing-associated H-X9-DG protein
MGIAATMYINESRFYPGHLARRGDGTQYAAWPTRLRKYMGNAQGVFRCPERGPDFEWKKTGGTIPLPAGAKAANLAEDSGYGYNVGEALLLWTSGKFSYGYNDWGSGQTPGVGGFIRTDSNSGQRGLGGDLWTAGGRELKATRVRKPAEMIMLADNNPDGVYDFNIDPRDPNEAPQPIHKGGSNVLWCDGHVTWKHQKELILYDPARPSIRFPEGAPSSIWNLNAPQWNNDGKP